MRYFKNFGDFCTGFSCFTVLIYLFRKFMLFKPKPTSTLDEEIGIREKLEMFFSKEERLQNLLLLTLALMLIISVVASVLLKKLPYLSLIFSVPPMLFVLDLTLKEQIEDYPMLILLLTIIAPISQLTECLRRDREDKGCRIGVAGDIICIGVVAFLLYLRSKVNALADVSTLEAIELNYFDREIYGSLDTAKAELLLWMAIAYAVLALIRILLRDIYFIDLALSLVPLGVLIYHLNDNALNFHGEIIIALAFAVTVSRAVATFGGVAKIKYKRKRS